MSPSVKLDERSAPSVTLEERSAGWVRTAGAAPPGR